MPAEIDASVVSALHGLLGVLSGTRQLTLAVAGRLPVKAEDDETPETGAMLLGSRLRCIVSDQLDSAIEGLKSLIDEAASEAPFSETAE
jgi:hypothetical protein